MSTAEFAEATTKSGQPLGLTFRLAGTLDDQPGDVFFQISLPRPDFEGSGCANSTTWAWHLPAERLRPGAFSDQVPAYWFAQTHPLLPGTYEVCVSEKSLDLLSVEKRGPFKAILSPGREGLVRRAWVSFTKKGSAIPPPVVADPREALEARLRGKPRYIWAHFSFAILPKVRPVTMTWYRGARSLGSVRFEVKATVATRIARTDGRPLDPAAWRVVLRAGRIPVGELRIKLSR